MENISDVANVISKYLKDSGYNVAYIDYGEKIQEFLSWYKGKTGFHNYKIYNGENFIECERASLNMAKTVCEDMASLELNEKCSITLNEELAQEYIDSVLEDNNFQVMGNQLMEIKNALGGGAFVENIENINGMLRPTIDYIHGDMIFPLTWDNGRISECAFVKVGGSNEEVEYTILMHLYDEKKNEYIIKLVELDSKGDVVKPFEIGSDLKEAVASGTTDEIIFETHSQVPLFQYIKPNIVNNYDKTNPLGISMFGNAIDILKSIDVIYDSWRNEFVLGKKRIFVKSDLKKVVVNTGNEITNQIDSNDVIFYQLDWTGKDNDKPPIYESQMTIRAMEHVESLDKQLNLLSRKCGLGDNFYAFNNGAVARTATEVISTNSSLFRNLHKNELIIKSAIIGMVRALLVIGNNIQAGVFDVNQDITVNFDDSIIEDTEKEKQQAMNEYNAGLIDRVQYFVETRDMTREQAIKFIAEMDATNTMKEVSSILNNFGGGII